MDYLNDILDKFGNNSLLIIWSDGCTYQNKCSNLSSALYLKRTNFRVYKFSRISRILAKFAKLNTREISCWVKFAKINTREKKFKNSKFRMIFLLLILSDIKET